MSIEFSRTRQRGHPRFTCWKAEKDMRSFDFYREYAQVQTNLGGNWIVQVDLENIC